MTRDDVEELLRQVHEGELDEARAAVLVWIACQWHAPRTIHGLMNETLTAYRDWLAVESDPDTYCDPAANWQCDERERVKDRARCDLMDAIDRLLQERAA